MNINDGVIASPPIGRGFGGPDDRMPLALAAGLVAALVGGGVWAAIALYANLEIGWAAWGVGALVGFAMGAATAQRSRKLALAAAALAILGLLLGKAFIFSGSTGMLADEIVENPEYLAGAVAWQMFENAELQPGTMERLAATEAAGDTLSDALWAEMLAQASSRIESMTATEREALATSTANAALGEVGMVQGVLFQITLWDAIWLFLAVGTAFQMMDAREEEPETVPVAEAATEEPGA